VPLLACPAVQDEDYRKNTAGQASSGTRNDNNPFFNGLIEGPAARHGLSFFDHTCQFCQTTHRGAAAVIKVFVDEQEATVNPG
jgi:hypothetical protein